MMLQKPKQKAAAKRDLQNDRSNAVGNITEILRNEVVTGFLRPGERLNVADLAKRHSVGQIPIREALRLLEGEGQLTSAPNRGWTVRSLDADFIRQLYDVRIVLEQYLIRCAVEQMSMDSIERIREKCQLVNTAIREGDFTDFLRLDQEFHTEINRIAGNEEAIRIIQSGGKLVHAFREIYGFGTQRAEIIVKEHDLLVEALSRGDTDAAERTMRMHSIGARNDLIAILQGNPHSSRDHDV